MKLFGALTLALASLLGAVGAAHVGETPITRIVKLLQGLSKKTEQDGKVEEDLYESFVCWAKSVVEEKTSSNAAAESRIEYLSDYIADIEAGRIEFSTERVDLEKGLKDVNGEIQDATALRKKEAGEFEDASEEMQQAVTALTKAMVVLDEATKEHAAGVFAQQQARLGLGEGFAARQQEAVALKRAADLGSKVLSGGDALFLRRLLTGEVPKPDWKKLNRKATFKMDYKARSFKIQDVLKKLKTEFETSLATAKTTEAEAVKTFDALMSNKNDEKSGLEQRLLDMSEETGARQMNKEDSQTELDDLKKQVENDTKFIKQTEDDLAEKKEEWKDRLSLREAEIAAFSKAIEILYNDDARDLAAKSFKSQAKSFLQEASSTAKGTSVARLLKEAARQTHSARLAGLAGLAAGSHFDEVLKAIATMITDLKAEEQKDLEDKEECESDRAEDARSAVAKSRSIDDTTDAMGKMAKEIKEISVEITDTEANIKQAKKDIKEAKTQRDEEHAEWVSSDAEDKDMAATVKRAGKVLTDFYKDNDLAFLQSSVKAKARQPAGAAPPPPPSTWDAPYGGNQEATAGITTILEMVGEDIQKDMEHALAAEEKAAARFTDFEKETQEQVKEMQDSVTELDGVRGATMQKVSEAKKARNSEKGLLKSVMERMAEAKPGCDFITVNYAPRLKNRQIEMDGLEKAKTILMGGVFTKVDENREIKPGDASFLQRRK